MAGLYSVVHKYLIAFLCLLIDTRIDSSAWLVEASQSWGWKHAISSSGGATALGICSTFSDVSELFSLVATLIYIPTLVLHIIFSIYVIIIIII